MELTCHTLPFTVITHGDVPCPHTLNAQIHHHPLDDRRWNKNEQVEEPRNQGPRGLSWWRCLWQHCKRTAKAAARFADGLPLER